MSAFDVLSVLKKFRGESLDLFIYKELRLKDMEEMFVPRFSDIGSNDRLKEEAVMVGWALFLKQCNRGKLKRNVTDLSKIEEKDKDPKCELDINHDTEMEAEENNHLDAKSSYMRRKSSYIE